MTTVLELRLLPAAQGDAIWVRWGAPGATYQMIVDMGTHGVGNMIRNRLKDLDAASRRFELLVVTHIDADHIGGVLSCLVDVKDELDGFHIEDVWFNGLHHLEKERPQKLEGMGAVQGKALSAWLERQRWNKAFGGGPVCRDEFPPTRELEGGMKLTIIGPTPSRLAQLAPTWRTELQIALRKQEEREKRAAIKAGLEPLGRKKRTKPRLRTKADLAALAAKVTGKDPSKANGSSIVLLLEYYGRRILLAGDAYAQDMVAGIRSLSPDRPMPLDALKLPHHGSGENTTRDLIESVDCEQFLFSTDGTQYEHPHAEAVACVIAASRRRPASLAFNCRSQFTGWWDNDAWRSEFDFTTSYGVPDEGLVLSFRE